MYYEISDDLLSAMQNATRQTAELTITKTGWSSALTVTDEDIPMNGFTLDRYSMTGSRLELGCVAAHQLTVKLMNTTGKFNGIEWDGAQIAAHIIVDGTSVNVGYFFVTEAEVGVASITLVAMDYLSQIDTVMSFTGVTFPMTISSLASTIASKLSTTVTIPTGYANTSATINKAPEGEITYRTLLSWIAQIIGATCVYIDYKTGAKAITFGKYNISDTPFILTGDHRYYSLISSYDVEITGICCTIGNTTYLAGSDGYTIDISGNGLMPNMANIPTVMNGIGNLWTGFDYRPFTATTLAFPHLMPTDIISLLDNNLVLHRSIVTHMMYKMNGRGTVEGKGLSPTAAEAQIDPRTTTVRTATDNSIVQVDVYYALGDTTTTAPTTGWSVVAPAWTSGKYMWQKTVWTYGSGATSESSPTCIAGAKGDKGADGTSVTILGSYNTYAELIAAHPTGSPGDAYMVGSDLYVWSDSTSSWQNVGQIKGDTGVGVSAITEQYYKSTNSTTPTGGSWVNTCPAWESGYYIFTRQAITWTNSTTTYTAGTLAGAINSANEKAAEAETKADSATETAEEAESKAESAETKADSAETKADSADTKATDAKTKAEAAIKRTQQIFYLNSTSAVPSVPGATWVTSTSTASGAWTTSMPAVVSGYTYFSCMQYETGAGAIANTDIKEMSVDTQIANWSSSSDSTMIDGGHLYAASVTTPKLATDAIKSTNYDVSEHVIYRDIGLYTFSVGNYSVLIDSVRYYFTTTQAISSAGAITISSDFTTVKTYTFAGTLVETLTASTTAPSGTVTALALSVEYNCSKAGTFLDLSNGQLIAPTICIKDGKAIFAGQINTATAGVIGNWVIGETGGTSITPNVRASDGYVNIALDAFEAYDENDDETFYHDTGLKKTVCVPCTDRTASVSDVVTLQDLTNKNINSATFQTTAPTAAITDGGVHIVYLSAEPATKYDGYIYLIAE